MSCGGCDRSKNMVFKPGKGARTRDVVADGSEQTLRLPGYIVGITSTTGFKVLIRDCCKVTFCAQKGSIVTVAFIEEPVRRARRRSEQVQV